MADLTMTHHGALILAYPDRDGTTSPLEEPVLSAAYLSARQRAPKLHAISNLIEAAPAAGVALA